MLPSVKHGDVITVAVTPNDGTVNGTEATASVTVANTAPVITSLSLTPSAPSAGQTVSAIVTSSDADGDTVTYTYQWFRNGQAIVGQYGSSLALTFCGIRSGDQITVQATPNDGTVSGAAVTSAPVKIK